jgi:hypothetical protein
VVVPTKFIKEKGLSDDPKQVPWVNFLERRGLSDCTNQVP